MENGFSNLSLTTSNQSIFGSKDYKVQQLDFDTSCPCQITACDGGTIKVCAKMEIEDLVLDTLCIDGELGCDSLVLESGLTEGIKFAADPCDPTSARKLTLYDDPFDSITGVETTTFQSIDGNLQIKAVGPTPARTGRGDIRIAAYTNTIVSTKETSINALLIRLNGGTQIDSIGNLTCARPGLAIGTTGIVSAYRVNIGMGYGPGGVARGLPPPTNVGVYTDKSGDIAFDTTASGIYFYCCFQDYADAPFPGVSRIWWRSPLFNGSF
jgi:hypothetical protein